MKRVVVVGGGISGLASAYRIRQEARESDLPLSLVVVEAGTTMGGKVQSERTEGYVCEAGPQGFLDNEPATLRLVDDLGLRDRLLPSEDSVARRFIYRNHRFHELSMNPLKFLASPLLSFRGKLSMAGEYFRSPRLTDDDESVRAFGERRLGREFTEVMLDSMVSGIHAGDISRLSLPAAFPKIATLEREYGGLFRGMFQKRKEAKRQAKATGTTRRVEAGPGGILHSFDKGMAVPIEALTRNLREQDLRLATRATRVEAHGRGYRVFLENSLGEASTLDAEALVLALPAPGMARILNSLVPAAADALSQVPLAGVHVVCLGYERAQVRGDVRGFGALIPRGEGLRTLGVLYIHATFAGHAPGDHVLLRAMVGGRHDPQANELGDEELRQLVQREISPLLRIQGEPGFRRNFRWNEGIPQYELGHLQRIASAREALADHRGIFLTGNSICGIAFNSCVAHSEEIGREVTEYLLATPGLEEAPC